MESCTATALTSAARAARRGPRYGDSPAPCSAGRALCLRGAAVRGEDATAAGDPPDLRAAPVEAPARGRGAGGPPRRPDARPRPAAPAAPRTAHGRRALDA